MKKFLIIFFLILFANLNLKSFATNEIQYNTNRQLITFIYINGSNDLSYKNRLKFKENFDTTEEVFDEKNTSDVQQYYKKEINNSKDLIKLFIDNIQVNTD